jgi:hypothetical protein
LLYTILAAHAQADTSQFLRQYCAACHSGKAAQGGFSLEHWSTDVHARLRAKERIENGSMPPKGLPAPSLDLRESITAQILADLKAEACTVGIVTGPRPLRRLNRDEYSATIEDLLDIHLDLASRLPEDGAGGEGFDNAAETLFLSPLHSEKYLDTAKFALDYAAKEAKSRERLLVAKPTPNTPPAAAARAILAAFLPRAFRRPVSTSEIDSYLALFRQAQQLGHSFEPAVFFSLRAALVSPQFLFRQETGQYALASRLSYFLWGSMPDDLLRDLAAQGILDQPKILAKLVPRMLRHDRSLRLAQRFTAQWLKTRDLHLELEEELRADIRLQPALFFREMLVRQRSLLDLIDSEHTIGTSNLETHFNLKLPLDPGRRKQPQWVALPPNSNRGGILGMPAMLAVSSHVDRTSPVLRGAFLLDAVLGTPPPPAPPNVPPLETNVTAKTVRERLEQHRANPACASCHSRIDPLGFALENYDPLGRWRDFDSGKPVDNRAELHDGRKFAGPAELRQLLLEKKSLFLRNLTNKMLGYALGRGLTLQDSCAVDAILEDTAHNGFNSAKWIDAIVLSKPFRANSTNSEAPKP